MLDVAILLVLLVLGLWACGLLVLWFSIWLEDRKRPGPAPGRDTDAT